MQLTEGERFILRLLADIGEQLQAVTGNTGEFDCKFIKAAVLSRNAWALQVKYHIDGEAYVYPPAVVEVQEILGMWEDVERSFVNLSAAEKRSIITAEEVPYFAVD
jgi:hypothetical protein